MSRLKGADLGVTNPTLASLGAAKNTISAGWPGFAGRNPGDGHYNQTTKQEGILTGAAASTISDAFGSKTPGSNLIGQNTDTGSKTWATVNTGAGGNNSLVVNGDGTVGPAGTGGVWYAAGLTGLTASARTISVDVITTAAAITAANVNDQAVIDAGDSSAAQSSGPITVTFRPGAQRMTVVVDASATPVNNATFASLGIATGQTRHTVVIEIHNDKTYVVMVDGVVVSSGSFTRSIGTFDGIWTTAGSAVTAVELDNYTITDLGTLAWTAITPPSPLNYRGNWSASASPAYATNDVALRNGLPYAASVAPGSTDPAGGIAVLGAQTQSVGAGGNVGAPIASRFQVSSAITVTTVELLAASSGITAGATVGISSDFGAGGTPSYLGSGSAPAAASGAWSVVPLNTPVTLQPGVWYRVVYNSATGSPQHSGTQTLTGAVSATGDSMWNLGGGWTQFSTNDVMVFRLDGNPWQALTSPQENVNTVTASGATQTLPDVTTATMHKVTLTANCTITLPAPGAGKSFTVELVQDATGGRTVTWATPSGAIKWPGGTVPTISSAANAIDVITFVSIGGTNWYGFVAGQAFA